MSLRIRAYVRVIYYYIAYLLRPCELSEYISHVIECKRHRRRRTRVRGRVEKDYALRSFIKCVILNSVS